MIDSFRYALALLLVCGVPPLVVAWPVVHGFIPFWRRIGPWRTYVVVLGGAAAIGAVCFGVRERLLGADYGAQWSTAAPGVACLLIAVWLRLKLNRDFTAAHLMGLPELAPTPANRRLVRTGLFARVRHPRYVQFGIALLGHALIANYAGGYVAWMLWAPGAYLITWFEEHELRDRFGEDYERYARSTPRFVPRRRGDD